MKFLQALGIEKIERHPKSIDFDTVLCPACGWPGCKPQFNVATKRVDRTCNTCGCVASQPPVAPELFK